jgi:hypothetical protein
MTAPSHRVRTRAPKYQARRPCAALLMTVAAGNFGVWVLHLYPLLTCRNFPIDAARMVVRKEHAPEEMVCIAIRQNRASSLSSANTAAKKGGGSSGMDCAPDKHRGGGRETIPRFRENVFLALFVEQPG